MATATKTITASNLTRGDKIIEGQRTYTVTSTKLCRVTGKIWANLVDRYGYTPVGEYRPDHVLTIAA